VKTLGQIAFEATREDDYTQWDEIDQGARDEWETGAAAVRTAVLEDAAQFFDGWYEVGDVRPDNCHSNDVAAELRDMKDKP
jgi:hypothetical protein